MNRTQPERPVSPDSIVVGVDGSPDSDRAVQWAAEQAALERRPLVLVAAANPAPALVAAGQGAAYAYDIEGLLEGARGVVDAAVELAVQHRPGVRPEGRAVVGNPRNVLADLTPHLLVLGSRGRGPVTSKVLGSVSATIARTAPFPVVVCRPGTTGKVKKGVLVGADGTEESLAVIDFAFRQASLRSLPLTVLHSYVDPTAPAEAPHLATDTAPESRRLLAAESVAGFRERYPEVQVAVEVAHGYPAETLAAIADRYDLVVVGHHPQDSVGSRLMIATATAVLERAHTTVAVVPEAAPAG